MALNVLHPASYHLPFRMACDLPPKHGTFPAHAPCFFPAMAFRHTSCLFVLSTPFLPLRRGPYSEDSARFYDSPGTSFQLQASTVCQLYCRRILQNKVS